MFVARPDRKRGLLHLRILIMTTRAQELLVLAEAKLCEAETIPGADDYRAELTAAMTELRESLAARDEAVKGYWAVTRKTITGLVTEFFKKHRATRKAAPSSLAGSGVTIKADNVTVSGMEDVANMLQRLDATLRSPVTPIYGKDGMLIGAKRVDHLPEA